MPDSDPRSVIGLCAMNTTSVNSVRGKGNFKMPILPPEPEPAAQ